MNAMAGYSVQQIKFDFLSYIKEFGADGADWCISCSTEPVAQGEHGPTVPDGAIWICKPALSPRAARMVHDHMVSRHQVQIAPRSASAAAGNWIFMYRSGRRADLFPVETQRAIEKQVETDCQLS